MTMSIESDIFSKSVPMTGKLEAYGFTTQGNDLVIRKELMDGEFEAIIRVDEEGGITGTVMDLLNEEEYFPMRIMNSVNSYASQVRSAYEELLTEIRRECCLILPFVSEQANRITAAIAGKYGDAPEFPWDDEVNSSSGVFRDPGSRKWYGLIMRIDRVKLEGKKEEKTRKKAKNAETEPVEYVDVMNLKIHEEDGEQLRKEAGIYPAWHMNHRTWISVVLDDTLSDERIMELVEVSYRFAHKGSARRPGDCREWLIPANPKYYDVVTDFDANSVSDWKQGKGIEVGDIAYLYVGQPYSGILYRMKVLKTHIPYKYEGEINVPELMDVQILNRYEKTVFDREILRKFGVNTVRGPRFMPKELSDYIKERSAGSEV